MTKLTDRVSRREAVKVLGVGAALVALGRTSLRAQETKTRPLATAAATGPFSLPALPFAYDALEPHIDAQTMELHHSKHHQTYITAANKALDPHEELRARGAAAILQKLDEVPESIRTAVRNNLGGHVNHAFFWTLLNPQGGGTPRGELAEAIDGTFGGFASFQKQFADAAAKRFGSGWAWLVWDGGKLSIVSTPNQDSPLSREQTPVLGLDVWEHAYYLKYQNRRADYVNAWWNVVNWDQANEYFRAARKQTVEGRVG